MTKIELLQNYKYEITNKITKLINDADFVQVGFYKELFFVEDSKPTNNIIFKVNLKEISDFVRNKIDLENEYLDYEDDADLFLLYFLEKVEEEIEEEIRQEKRLKQIGGKQ